jgi:RecB family endonuclease NucS
MSKRLKGESEQDLSRTLRELREQVGGLGNQMGEFTESISESPARDLLMNHFRMDTVLDGIHVRRGAETIEIDMMGTVNGKRNEVILVEIKTRLNVRAVKQLQELIERFPLLMPQYKRAKVRGLLVAGIINKEGLEAAKAAGFNVARLGANVALI